MSGNYRGHRGGRGRGNGGRGGRGNSNNGGSFRGNSPYRGGYGGGYQGQPTVVYSGERALTDPQVQHCEDTTVSTRQNRIGAQLESQMPHRPDYGSAGTPVRLLTNYFPMENTNSVEIKRYTISIKAGTKAKTAPAGKRLHRIVELLLEDHLSKYSPGIASDFKANLVCKEEIAKNLLETKVVYRAENEDEPAAHAQTFDVKLAPAGSVTVKELIDYLLSTKPNAVLTSKPEILQVLNMVVGHHAKASDSIDCVGASKHFARQPVDETETKTLGNGLVALRGFFLSVRAATARQLVNVQIKHAAFYEQGSLTALIRSFDDYNAVAQDKFLRRVAVGATHFNQRNKKGEVILRVKSICGLAHPEDGIKQEKPPKVARLGAGAKEVQFFYRPSASESTQPAGPKQGGGRKGKFGPGPGGKASNGRYITVFDYFKEVYNITIADLKAPVINVGSKADPSYLPAQVCQVMPGQATAAKLSPSQTRNMIQFAVRKPAENATSIARVGSQLLGFNDQNATLKAFGLKIEPKLVTVSGRVLSPPKILLADKKLVDVEAGKGQWKVGKGLKTVRPLSSWGVLNILSESGPKWANWPKDDAQLRQFLTAFTTKMEECGFWTQDDASVIETCRVTEADRTNQIDAFMQRVKPNVTKLLLVVLPSSDAGLYNIVKYLGDVKYGIPTVCICADHKNLSKWSTENNWLNQEYCQNVALKMNLKLGGSNFSLDQKDLGMLNAGTTMVVGIDVTHPSPGSASDAPSVAGMVASINKDLCQWPAELRVQQGKQEMVSDISGMFKARLIHWRQVNSGSLPNNILVYRDGVSEGQYQIVLDKELVQLKAACKDIYSAKQTQEGIPKISIVVVGKRHNTRFYPTEQQQASVTSNPKAGTVVDRVVTEVRNWDFFLQAHHALQGTARPAHYYVVHDEIFRSRDPGAYNHAKQTHSDELQRLTYNLCHTFGRATKAVSTCPPAYYADLVCERARCYLPHLFDPKSLQALADGSQAASAAAQAPSTPGADATGPSTTSGRPASTQAPTSTQASTPTPAPAQRYVPGANPVAPVTPTPSSRGTGKQPMTWSAAVSRTSSAPRTVYDSSTGTASTINAAAATMSLRSVRPSRPSVATTPAAPAASPPTWAGLLAAPRAAPAMPARAPITVPVPAPAPVATPTVAGSSDWETTEDGKTETETETEAEFETGTQVPEDEEETNVEQGQEEEESVPMGITVTVHPDIRNKMFYI